MMQAKLKAREQHKSKLVKFLLVADISLGANFITQLKVHWSCAKVGYEEMTQKKLVNVATVKVDPQENWNLVKILKWEPSNSKPKLLST
jgi:hypothetical protein